MERLHRARAPYFKPPGCLPCEQSARLTEERKEEEGLRTRRKKTNCGRQAVIDSAGTEPFAELEAVTDSSGTEPLAEPDAVIDSAGTEPFAEPEAVTDSSGTEPLAEPEPVRFRSTSLRTTEPHPVVMMSTLTKYTYHCRKGFKLSQRATHRPYCLFVFSTTVSSSSGQMLDCFLVHNYLLFGRTDACLLFGAHPLS